MNDSLAPCLLVASPALSDDGFHRTVVLLTESSESGALGFVLNRKTPFLFEEVARELDVPYTPTPERDASIYAGGPVSPERGWILFRDEERFHDDGSVIEVTRGVKLGITVDLLKTFLSPREDRPFKFLLGYAGWGPGQLEAELKEGAWLPLDFRPDLLFETPADRLWDESIRRLGLAPGAFFMVPGGDA